MEFNGLRKTIRKKELKTKLIRIWDFAEELNASSNSKTIDGIGHCKRVDKNLERLVKQNIGGKYSVKEKFLLSAAAALHDLYKGVEPYGWDHGKMAAHRLKEDLKFIDDGPRLKIIGFIVSIHDRGSIRSIPLSSVPFDDGNELFLPKLALLFKLADMLDCTYRRINSLRILTGIETSSEKENSRLAIVDWRIEGKNKLFFCISPNDKDQLQDSMIGFKMIYHELAQHDLALHLLGFPTKFIPELMPDVIKNVEIQKTFDDIISGKIELNLPEDPKITYSSRAHIRLIFYKDGIDKVLMKKHRGWNGQFLVPNLPMIFRTDDSLTVFKRALSKRYNLNENEFKVEDISEEKFIQKRSKQNDQMTQYCYKIAKIKLLNNDIFPRESFQMNSTQYKWVSVEQCISEKQIYDGNEEIIKEIADIFYKEFVTG